MIPTIRASHISDNNPEGYSNSEYIEYYDFEVFVKEVKELVECIRVDNYPYRIGGPYEKLMKKLEA